MLNLKDDYVKTNYDYIYKHKTNGTYAVVLPLYDKIYNKRTKKRKSNLKTIKDAQNFIAVERVKFNNEQDNQPKKSGLFKDVFDSYIKECELEVKKGNLAESTVNGKKEIFKNQILPKLGNVKLIEISEKHIYKFHNDLLSMTCLREKGKKLSNQTLIKTHKQLSAFLNYCVKKRLITYNPAGVVGNFKKVKKEKEYLTHQEFEKLLSVIDIKSLRNYYLLLMIILEIYL